MDQGCLGLSLERDQASQGGKTRTRDKGIGGIGQFRPAGARLGFVALY